MYCCGNATRIRTDENYYLKSKITLFVTCSSYTQLISSTVIFQPNENEGQNQRFQGSVFHAYN